MKPFFSVIIPLYNKEKYVYKTLKSVLNQSFTGFEVLIINDGSTDKSLDIISYIKDDRIQIYSQNNQGLSITRNTGIKKAKAKHIAFIDADDLWYPNHLQQLHDLIALYPNNGIYCTGYTLQKSKNKFHRANFNNLPKNFKGIVPDFFKHSLQHCIAWIGAVCIVKSVFDDVGYFDLDIFSEQDTDLYIRVALKYGIVLDNTSASAIYNRTMDDNMSNFSFKKKIPKFLYSYKKIELENPYLKKYIDLNRFSTLIPFKLSSNKELEKKILEDIDLSNLNFLQRLLIFSPNSLVKFLFKIKTKFHLNPLIIFKFKNIK